jgi:hypothetical protein
MSRVRGRDKDNGLEAQGIITGLKLEQCLQSIHEITWVIRREMITKNPAPGLEGSLD